MNNLDNQKIQQKDLAIHRMKGYNNFEFQYELFIDGQYCKNTLSGTKYRYGIVNINPMDGSITMHLKENITVVTDRELEDKSNFLVPVTIKN
jgi:hypothetical protein